MRMKLCIVGGGHAARVLIETFRFIDYITLCGVIDRNQGAPGVALARSLGIPAFDDLAALETLKGVDTVIELTGNEQVRHAVMARLRPHQHFMSSNAAKIMCDFIEIQTQRRGEVVAKISTEFGRLTERLRSAETHIEGSIRNVEEVLTSMKIVAMNARIEAARAGESGSAFKVVVQSMQDTLASIETALKEITRVSSQSRDTMSQIVDAESKLRQTLLGEES